MKPRAQTPTEVGPLPNNYQAEQAVLGGILLNNAALLGVAELLTPEDFFTAAHGYIFKQILELHASNVAIDILTLTDKLAQEEKLTTVGGSDYLFSLADNRGRLSNLEHYARIVKEKSLLRKVIHATAAIQQEAFASKASSVVLNEARTRLNELGDLQEKSGLVPINQIVRDAVPRIEKIFSEGQTVTGLATGYPTLDRELAGLQPSELIILAARPSFGKSALALNITENILLRAGAAQPVAFFSLLFRLLASQSHIDAHKFRTGYLSKENRTQILLGCGTIAGTQLWIDDGSSSTVAEIGARAERLQRDQALALVIVDYLQLVGSSRRYANRQEEVSDVSRGLKAIAKDLKVPVLALSQLKRSVDRDEDRVPQLSDLRESGAIEQDADVVLFLHRPHMYKKEATELERSEAQLIIGKQRNGPVSTLPFIFRGQYTRFEEAAPPSMFQEEHLPYKENEYADPVGN